MSIKMILSILTFTALTGTAIAVDYGKVQEELDVMADIMKRAVKNNDECSSCSVTINDHYLANQGAVFYLKVPGIPRFVAFSGDGGMDIDPGRFDLEVEPLAGGIRTIVDDVFAGVEGTLQGIEINTDEDHYNFQTWPLDATDGLHSLLPMDKEQREALREIRDEGNDLRRKMSRLRIKLRKASDDSEEELEALEELEEENERLQKELEMNNKRYLAAIEERNNRLKEIRVNREARRKERAEKRKQRNELIKTLVLNSLCEYQATLRNLPDKERISLIFEGMTKKNRANVYVIEKSSLDNCESNTGKLKDKALKYMI